MTMSMAVSSSFLNEFNDLDERIVQVILEKLPTVNRIAIKRVPTRFYDFSIKNCTSVDLSNITPDYWHSVLSGFKNIKIITFPSEKRPEDYVHHLAKNNLNIDLKESEGREIDEAI